MSFHDFHLFVLIARRILLLLLFKGPFHVEECSIHAAVRIRMAILLALSAPLLGDVSNLDGTALLAVAILEAHPAIVVLRLLLMAALNLRAPLQPLILLLSKFGVQDLSDLLLYELEFLVFFPGKVSHSGEFSLSLRQDCNEMVKDRLELRLIEVLFASVKVDVGLVALETKGLL